MLFLAASLHVYEYNIKCARGRRYNIRYIIRAETVRAYNLVRVWPYSSVRWPAATIHLLFYYEER